MLKDRIVYRTFLLVSTAVSSPFSSFSSLPFCRTSSFSWHLKKTRSERPVKDPGNKVKGLSQTWEEKEAPLKHQLLLRPGSRCIEPSSLLFKSGRSSSPCEAMMKAVLKPGIKVFNQLSLIFPKMTENRGRDLGRNGWISNNRIFKVHS